ncbi:hypothetical protein SAMN05880570_3683 [Paenibacillus sp. RU4T]|uniref:hypothetical protein n=1 Tax=unclassified Paenibacillus TaxID=185978 RepID=UPI000955786E|nr:MULTISPECIES: hypothetical protein [unclassified Paenibacillus]SIR40684.1 hypothetical protein SAMN05880555_3681 [Paenibacillus sp. RU4X]SIR50837.1 hypothetical protein SAMN05880570_3683 [Paenibacillus sp. RU4T]
MNPASASQAGKAIAPFQLHIPQKAQEARLNRLSPFTAGIDGTPIRFIHVRSEDGAELFDLPKEVPFGRPALSEPAAASRRDSFRCAKASILKASKSSGSLAICVHELAPLPLGICQYFQSYIAKQNSEWYSIANGTVFFTANYSTLTNTLL